MNAGIAPVVFSAQRRNKAMISPTSLSGRCHDVVQFSLCAAYKTAQGREPVHMLLFDSIGRGLGLGLHARLHDTAIIAARCFPLCPDGRTLHASGEP